MGYNKIKGSKKIVIIVLLLLIAASIYVWHIFTEKFGDTTNQTADYVVNATDFLKEFATNDTLANKKYAEKIITVNGKVFEIESVDTTINIKMKDTVSGAQAIFAFQQTRVVAANQQAGAIPKGIKEGDNVSIKGSCSGGVYSSILGAEFINFKRCVLNK